VLVGLSRNVIFIRRGWSRAGLDFYFAQDVTSPIFFTGLSLYRSDFLECTCKQFHGLK